MRVKCLAQEHNTVFPARALTRTARSGNKRTNHEATAPPLKKKKKETRKKHVKEKWSLLKTFKSHVSGELRGYGQGREVVAENSP